jgi:alpha-2-macroglobulin
MNVFRNIFHAAGITGIVIMALSGSAHLQESEYMKSFKSTDDHYSTLWSGVDRLVDQQKFREAESQSMQILEKAMEDGNDVEWTKAFTRILFFRQTLHGYETSVRFLLETPWPSDPVGRALLNLVGATAIKNYHDAYHWEIVNRETVSGEESLDIRTWTSAQLFRKAGSLYADAWKERDRLGSIPVTAFPECIDRRNYPEDIRITLRDFLAYQWAEFLSNSTMWTPGDSAGLYKLPFDDWLKDGKTCFYDTIDSALHPLEQAMRVITDLQAWHQSRRDRQNVLETYFERLRILQQHFTRRNQKTAIESAYARIIDQFIDVPWSASGLWELAGLMRNANRFKEAYDTARKGWETHPKSMGGRLCRELMSDLEAPRYTLNIMASDRPDTRSIRITHANIDRLYFRAYRLDFEALREQSLNQGYSSLYMESRKQSELIHEHDPDYTWSADLENPGDYADHATYSTPPIPEYGLYLVAASFNREFSKSKNRIDSVIFLVSPLVMISSGNETQFEIQVLDGHSGNPVPAAGVTLHVRSWNRQQKTQFDARTDPDGRAVFDNTGTHSVLAVARKGTAFACQQMYIGREAPPRSRIVDYIYTDRSIYRPGQQVYVKVLSFQGKESDFKTLPGRALTLAFSDPNGELIESVSLQTNSYGSASAEFTIPEGRVLGAYRLRSGNGQASLRVEEYKRPTFEVAVKPPETAAALNYPVTVKGQADYYFGMPVSEGTVTWRVVRKPQWPSWWFWWRPMPDHSVQIAAGETTLGLDGGFDMSFLPEADPDVDDQSVTWRFEITADVTDSGGETRTGRTTVILGYCAVTADISMTGSFFPENISSELTITRMNLDGKPRPGEGRYHIVRLIQPEQTRPASDLPVPEDDLPENALPGDTLQPRWTSEPGYARRMRDWKSGTTIDEGILDHDARGNAVIRNPYPAGAYRVYYTTHDENGKPFSTQKEFLVMGTDVSLHFPLYLLVHKPSASAGDTMDVYFGSGYENKELWFEISQNNTIIRRERVTGSGKAKRVRFDVDQTLRGGFGLSVYMVHDYSLIRETLHVCVPWDNKELKLEFSTFRNLLRPGGEETWKVKVLGPDSERVAAELLAYMYDRSLDYFVPHGYPRIMDLYPDYSFRNITAWTLQAHFQRLLNDRWFDRFNSTKYQPDQMTSHSGYGIGGPGYRGDMVFARMKSAGGDDADTMELEQMAMAAPMGNVVADTDTTELGDAAAPPHESEPPPPPDIDIRSDFSETAFFHPHLTTDENGFASIAFTVPDSVTSWRVFVHAVTADMKSAVLETETETRKELMVRPYMPRFFREGDRGELRVVINNAGDVPLSGTVYLEISDPDTGKDCTDMFSPSAVRMPFTAPEGESDTVRFHVSAPRNTGFYAFKISAAADELTDGERRPVPVLPGRMHLAQSRFITLKDDESRAMILQDLLKCESDSSLIHESLVVTIEGQLFYHVLKALPYLVQYPYECVEQTLNRFLATGIVMSLYDQYPAVAKAAGTFSERDTVWEKWDEEDPNRRMALAETPWLQTARGGKTDHGLLNVLNPSTAATQRDTAIAKLQQAQKPSGAFPWFPGGPDSPFMTLYLLYGFAKAHEFDIKIPQTMVKNACRFLGDHFRSYYKPKLQVNEYSPEFLVFLNYVLSCFPDESWYSNGFSREERVEMLDHAFRNWKTISPYCKAMLSLTLYREQRSRDAQLVMDSIMDSAVTERDQGTFWAPEERGWLWYNDSIESHAMILRALMELEPDDHRTDGLALWLFLNKKMNHWKSTKTTAEVLYALAGYLRSRDAMGVRETASVTIGPVIETCVFDPDRFDAGGCRIQISSDDIEPSMGRVTVDKTGQGYMFASMNWQYSTDTLPEEARGDFLYVTRRYFLRENENGEIVLKPIKTGQPIAVGDQVEVHLSVTAKHPMEYVHLQDPRGAGFEPETHTSGYRWDLGLIRYEETRDSCTNFFFERLPQGEYTLRYRIRASMAGTFKIGPATLQSMYAPEFSAFSEGAILEIVP